MLLLYQNRRGRGSGLPDTFTFHYASTLSRKKASESIRTTYLHSTMLLLYRCRNKKRPEPDHNLHSTMLLLYRDVKGLEQLAINLFTFHYASTLSRPPFPLLFSSIQVYFLSTPLSSYLSSQKSSSSHFTKFKFSLIFQALSISQQFSSISGRQSQEITCLIIIHSPELLRYPLLISAFKYD